MVEFSIYSPAWERAGSAVCVSTRYLLASEALEDVKSEGAIDAMGMVFNSHHDRGC